MQVPAMLGIFAAMFIAACALWPGAIGGTACAVFASLALSVAGIVVIVADIRAAQRQAEIARSAVGPALTDDIPGPGIVWG
jgi:hypothetical protein